MDYDLEPIKKGLIDRKEINYNLEETQMKNNHKNRPVIGFITNYKNKMQLIGRIIEWEQWAKGQEKELQQMYMPTEASVDLLIKEILGE